MKTSTAQQDFLDSSPPESFRNAAILGEIFSHEPVQQVRIINHYTGEEYSAVEIWPSEGVLTITIEPKNL